MAELSPIIGPVSLAICCDQYNNYLKIIDDNQTIVDYWIGTWYFRTITNIDEIEFDKYDN